MDMYMNKANRITNLIWRPFCILSELYLENGRGVRFNRGTECQKKIYTKGKCSYKLEFCYEGEKEYRHKGENKVVRTDTTN